MLKILIDLTYIKSYNPTGVAIYAFRLIRSLMDINDNIYYIIATEENYSYIKNEIPSCNIIKVPEVNKYSLFNYIKRQYILHKIINRESINILFSPYIHLMGIRINKISNIGVIHDLQHIKLKTKIKGFIYKEVFYKIIKNYTNLVCISNYVKNEIKIMYPTITNINCIYNSIEINHSDQLKRKYNFPYILTVNTLEEYKNIETLILAYKLIENKIIEKLIIRAKPTKHWNKVLFPLITKLQLKDKCILINEYMDVKEMYSLYKNASLFVTTSLMEGFGFTPIEAAIHKVPVISTKKGALYETTLGLLEYYDPPTDEYKQANTILKDIEEERDTKKMENISNIFSNKYSPYKQASDFLQIFKLSV